jgi:hypothetical protein
MKYLVSCVFFLAVTVVIDAQNYGDIFVSDKVLVQRCAMPQSSSRMIAVGYPGGFNYAFDAIRCAPVFAWYGGFLDFSGETNGRGGKGSTILGIDRPLGIGTIPLRVGNPDKLPVTLEFNGYRRDSKTGEPTFLFEVDGVPVEQRMVSKGSESISIEWTYPKPTKVNTYYLLNPQLHARVQLSAPLRWSAPGVIEIPANTHMASVELTLTPAQETFERKVPDLSGAQLYQNYCSACHSVDGSKLIGPTFKGLLGRKQTVTRDGIAEQLIVSEAYILESIRYPQSAIVKGYEAVPMADFSAVLTDEQLNRLVGFLKDLN